MPKFGAISIGQYRIFSSEIRRRKNPFIFFLDWDYFYYAESLLTTENEQFFMMNVDIKDIPLF